MMPKINYVKNWKLPQRERLNDPNLLNKEKEMVHPYIFK